MQKVYADMMGRVRPSRSQAFSAPPQRALVLCCFLLRQVVAQVAGNKTDSDSEFETPCRANVDCPYRRMACNAGWPTHGQPSACMCLYWLYTDEAPSCKELNGVSQIAQPLISRRMTGS